MGMGRIRDDWYIEGITQAIDFSGHSPRIMNKHRFGSWGSAIRCIIRIDGQIVGISIAGHNPSAKRDHRRGHDVKAVIADNYVVPSADTQRPQSRVYGRCTGIERDGMWRASKAGECGFEAG